ncbi:hypothetical protein HMPREF1244_0059 [Streptococcus pyogenes GA19702]|nr:hypothetical protein HMPREF1244_0059 [Streptococcus pyogenes GA19702]
MQKFQSVNNEELQATKGGSILGLVVLPQKFANWVSGFFK